MHLWHNHCIALGNPLRCCQRDTLSINGDRLAPIGPGNNDCVRLKGRQHEQAKAPGTFWFQAFFFALENRIVLDG